VSAKTLDVRVSRSPQHPGIILAEQPAVAPVAIAAVVERARNAGHIWAAQSPLVRASALHQAAEALAGASAELEDLIVVEVGKPRVEARGEVARAIAILRYYAQQVLDPIGDTFHPVQPGLLYTERRPHGVAGLITPWNFPLAIPLWKAAPALAAGNAVLLKPSTEALGCALRLAGLLAPVLPEGLFTVLPGERDTAVAVIDAADVVSFTGSTAVGRSVAVAATTRGIPVQAEMGGHNAAVVLPDADLEPTAAMIIAAATGYAGQKCTATRRVIVVGDPAPFTDALRAALDASVVGDPDRADVTVGPLITEQARQTMTAAVADARAAGGRVVASRAELPDGGWFVSPAMVDGLEASHRLLQEETFAPLLALLAAGTIDEAVHLANATRYGLAASVHGHDLDPLLHVAGGLDAGLIKVNAPTTGVDFQLPFGGVRESSVGPREQGKAALQFYTTTRTVSLAINGNR
jgi:alpha-ketoglutaric semialdehyde dehydrogenase